MGDAEKTNVLIEIVEMIEAIESKIEQIQPYVIRNIYVQINTGSVEPGDLLDSILGGDEKWLEDICK